MHTYGGAKVCVEFVTDNSNNHIQLVAMKARKTRFKSQIDKMRQLQNHV